VDAVVGGVILVVMLGGFLMWLDWKNDRPARQARQSRLEAAARCLGHVWQQQPDDSWWTCSRCGHFLSNAEYREQQMRMQMEEQQALKQELAREDEEHLAELHKAAEERRVREEEAAARGREIEEERKAATARREERERLEREYAERQKAAEAWFESYWSGIQGQDFGALPCAACEAFIAASSDLQRAKVSLGLHREHRRLVWRVQPEGEAWREVVAELIDEVESYLEEEDGDNGFASSPEVQMWDGAPRLDVNVHIFTASLFALEAEEFEYWVSERAHQRGVGLLVPEARGWFQSDWQDSAALSEHRWAATRGGG
jgi:hypothetical protein